MPEFLIREGGRVESTHQRLVVIMLEAGDPGCCCVQSSLDVLKKGPNQKEPAVEGYKR